MAVVCCRKEYVEECEILVCLDAPAPHNPNLYSRLRFGLLASSWLPSPLGIFLWSVLHVMLLVVVGPVLWVLVLLTAFLFFGVLIYGQAAISIFFLYVLLSLYAAAFDLIFLLGRSIRFCWSLLGFLACHQPIVEWRGGVCFTAEFWWGFKASMRFLHGMLGKFIDGGLYMETKDRQFQTWSRWCEEVVHIHDAIALRWELEIHAHEKNLSKSVTLRP